MNPGIVYNCIRNLVLIFILTGISAAYVTGQTSIPDPVFSHERGFYTGPFDLTISVPEGFQVYYTLNGNEPTTGSIPYVGPISITGRAGDPNSYSIISTTTYEYATWAPPVGEVFKASVLRVSLFQDGVRAGPVHSHTYFVDGGMADRYDLPVISIVTDSLNLFDYDTGIYVLGRIHDEFRQQNPGFQPTFNGGAPSNYSLRGDEWERPMHIEMFEPGGVVGFAQDAGVRIHGGWSRNFRQKSLRLYSRSEYGTSRFRHRIFPEKTLDNFNRLILRNSGQDWTQTLIRDAFMQGLADDLGFDVLAYRPAVLFLNGEYWGIHNIRERYDVFYIETNHGVPGDQVDRLTLNSQVQEGSDQHYQQMISYIGINGLAEQDHFEYIETQMDVENFMNYYISNIYINNTDWPHNNIDYWRKRTEMYEPAGPAVHDGRWRWMMFDTDFGFGWNRPSDAYRYNLLERALDPDGSSGNNPWSTFLMRKLLENVEFRNEFIDRFADLLNTQFSPERVLARLEATKSAIEPYMQEHFDRWGYHDDRWQTPQNLNDWEARLDLMRHFAQTRAGWVRTHIASRFNLGSPKTLTVDVDNPGAGTVKVNTIHINGSTHGVQEPVYPWTGQYFNFRPVQVTAIPEPGYRFAGWSGRSTSDNETTSFSMSGDTQITAHFIEDTSGPDDPVHPVPHRLSDGWFTFRSWDATRPDSTYPAHMVFVQSQTDDPGIEDDVNILYHIPVDDYNADDLTTVGFPYNNTSRTRINGLGDAGISFINTGRGRDLGAAVLALDTRETTGIDVSWVGGTLQANSRTYNIRLQYRIGSGGIWQDVTDGNGQPAEYERSAAAGHEMIIGPVRLHPETDGQPYMQLRWKYYFTGTRLSEESGQRDMLRLDDITVTAATGSSAGEPPQDDLPAIYSLETNYPNPFNPGTMIRYSLPEAGSIRLVVYDILGKEISVLTDGVRDAGVHSAWFDGSGLSSGVYIYRLEAGGMSFTGKMMLVK
jgi:hypothetical protein